MKIFAASLAIIAGIAVNSICNDWSAQANADSCAAMQANLSAPLPVPDNDLPGAQFDRFLHEHPGICHRELSSDDRENAAFGGIIAAFLVYVFCLIFGKFQRWAER